MHPMADTQAETGRGGFRAHRRLGPLSAGVAVASLILATWTLKAGVIDDFSGPEPGWDGVNGSPNLQLIDANLLISQDFKVATDPANPFNTFGNIYYLTNLPVRQKQTLELRVDLVSANQDNVFTHLGTMNAAGGEYAFFKDLNEIGLLKWSAAQGCSVAFWETRSIQNQGVVLILCLTPMDDRLVIETKVMRKSDQAVLFRRSVVDGPGSDWPVPNPVPHGWQILTPDAGAPYKDDLTVVWLAMQHQTDGQQGLAELRWDNLEYDVYSSPYLEIAGGATLLTWPENTGEEQIMVAAESLSSSVWTPWPEPIFKRFGQCSMAVPSTLGQRFGKLVPGTQYIDDFSAPQTPFATRNPWRHANLPADELEVTNGVLRVAWGGPAKNTFAAIPPEPDKVVGDFFVSVDILSWDTAGSDSSWFGLGARLDRQPNSGPLCGYGAGLIRNQDGTHLLWGSYAGNSQYGPTFQERDFPLPYRLVFSAVGDKFSFRVLDPKTDALIREMSMTSNARTQGMAGFYFEAPEGLVNAHRITLDNFFMTGTKP